MASPYKTMCVFLKAILCLAFLNSPIALTLLGGNQLQLLYLHDAAIVSND